MPHPLFACDTCAFFDRHDNGIGQCRANSPTIDDQGLGAWPVVSPNDWCGEYGVLQEEEPEWR